MHHRLRRVEPVNSMNPSAKATAFRSSLAIAATVLLFISKTSPACPICLGPLPEPPLAERLQGSEGAIVAQPMAGNPGRFRIVAVIKGGGSAGDELVIAPRARQDAPSDERAPTILLVLEADPRGWSNLGNIDPDRVEMLRQWSALEPADKMNHDERRQRLGYFTGYLEHREPVIAAAAYAELA